MGKPELQLLVVEHQLAAVVELHHRLEQLQEQVVVNYLQQAARLPRAGKQEQQLQRRVQRVRAVSRSGGRALTSGPLPSAAAAAAGDANDPDK